jgi:hypothetical protein
MQAAKSTKFKVPIRSSQWWGTKARCRERGKAELYRGEEEAPSRAEEEAPISGNQNLSLQENEVALSWGKESRPLMEKEVMLRLGSRPQVG